MHVRLNRAALLSAKMWQFFGLIKRVGEYLHRARVQPRCPAPWLDRLQIWMYPGEISLCDGLGLEDWEIGIELPPSGLEDWEIGIDLPRPHSVFCFLIHLSHLDSIQGGCHIFPGPGDMQRFVTSWVHQFPSEACSGKGLGA